MHTFKSALLTLSLPLMVFSCISSQAAEMNISIEIPELKVAEYHNPYVAIWLENKDTREITNLEVWYDAKMADKEGNKWLKDLRQWWRKSGRSLDMPVDGITGATEGPGKYDLTFAANSKTLSELKSGNYRLRIEAAREVGGRELLNIPFHWPTEKPLTETIEGTSELGDIVLTIKP